MIRVEPWGVFVRLQGDDSVGFVRRQDWSWSRRVVDLTARVQPGEVVRCKVMGRRGQQWQLSRQGANPNPFPEFRRRHKVGQAVIGQVQLLAQRGAGVLVALDDGVDGFIPRSELPAAARDEDGFGVLHEDLVAAQILRFDDNRVILSVNELLRKEDQEYRRSRAGQQATFRQHPALGQQLEGLYWDLQLRETPEPQVTPRVRERIRRILVVEDKESVGESLERVFEFLDLRCDLARNLEQGKAMLAEHDYDLLIVDMNLSHQSGGDLLRTLPPDASLCVVILTASRATEWMDVLRGRCGQVFQKPTGVDQLLSWLDESFCEDPAAGEPASGANEEALFADDPPLFAADPPVSPGLFADQGEDGTVQTADAEDDGHLFWQGPHLTSGHRQQIERLLQKLQETTRADHCFVLSYRPGPLFEVVAGSFVPLGRKAQQDLDVSPVGNVIREARYLSVTGVDPEAAEFRHLRSVTEVGSFVGIPIEYSDQVSYGLFLIGRRPAQLKSISEDQLEPSSMAIGVQLAHRRLNEVIAQNQGLLLTGFLADSLLHEIRNELQSLDDFSAILLMLAKRLGSLKKRDVAGFNKATVEVREVSRRLNELVELFRNLAGQNPAQEIDLNEVIRRLRATLLPYAEEHDVQLDIDLDPDLPLLFANPKLVDQPILNLMINGIEQIASYGGPRRRLNVTTRLHHGDTFPVRVTVSDTGKGVHSLHHRRIFDPFFTTKPHGTGLGLYISRVFVERFGGRLELSRTFLFRGSELCILIPQSVITA